MTLTAEQERIVGSPASRVFVSAAAGSGKTRLLVERYLRAVLKEGLTPAQLPTVTFTRKAAGEIRRRIRAELLEHGRHDLAWRLDDAPIGTIHSLCSRVLRSRPLDADVDPAFSVLEEDRADIVAVEAYDRAWEDLVLASSMEERVLLARHRSCFRSVRTVYDTLRQEGEEAPFLRVPSPSTDVEAARAVLLGVLQEVRETLAGVRLGVRMAGNLEKAVACADWARTARSSWEDLEPSMGFVPHLGVGGKAKEVFTRMKEALLAFREALAGRYLAEVLELADRLLRRYHVQYRNEKRARGVLDFADLELGARRTLAAGARPFGAGSWLMVDEFQDTNGLQCDILDLLGTGGVLTVGDPYQSIYGFRGADVDVFRKRHAALADTVDGRVLVDTLSVNFRSSRPLLRALNEIFGHDSFFGGEFPALAFPGDEPDTAAEGAGADGGGEPVGAAGEGTPVVSVLVVEPADPAPDEGACEGSEAEEDPAGEDGSTSGPIGLASRFDAEAAVVAERIGGLLKVGHRPRDVVLLLRAFTHVAEFEHALRARGIPVYVVQGRGFFAREEFQDVRALLRLTVNPHDDPALVTVLRSPVVGLPDDVALMLRMDADACGSSFLWPVVRDRRFETTAPEYREPLVRTADRLAGLRARLGSPGLSNLIEDAVEAFDYDLVLLRGRNGRRRFANVRKVMRLAAEYEKLEGPDLAGFLEYLDARGELSGDREAGASVLAEEDDVVRVMTVHKAKGLEFPVVVLAGLGSAPARARESRPLMASGGRVGLRLSGPSGRSDDRLLLGAHAELSEEAVRRAEEEAARLYYVGATRAQERLLLVGSVKAGCPLESEAPLSRVLRALDVDEAIRGVDGPVHPVRSLDLTVEWVHAAVESGTMFDDGRDTPETPPPRTVEAPVFPDLRSGVLAVRQASFSALRRHEECPRAYYLERVLGLGEHLLGPALGVTVGAPEAYEDDLQESRADGGGALGRAIGTSVHRVLESVELQRRPEREEVIGLLTSPCPGEMPLDRDAMEHAARLVLAFWDSPCAHAVTTGTVFRERPFRFAHDGVIMTGFMDLVVEGDGGRWLVVDYKTNRLGHDGVESAFAPYQLQSRLYGLASLLAGASHVEVAVLFLESPSAPVTRTYRRDDMRSLLAELSVRLVGLQSGEFPKRYTGCETCGSMSICRSLAGLMV